MPEGCAESKQVSGIRHGDRVEIEMFDAKKHSIFGRIDQQVVKV